MNYIEFQIGGKLRGFKFGIGTLGDILLHYNFGLVELIGLLNKNLFSATPTMLYYAARFHSLSKGEPVTFTLQDFSLWLDDIEDPLNDKNIAAAMGVLVTSITKHLPKFEEAAPPLESEDTDQQKKN